MATLVARSRETRICLEVKPASVGMRVFIAIVCAPLFAIGIIAAVKVVFALATARSYLPYQWIIGTGLATLFTVIPAVGIYVVLKGMTSLCLDPDTGSVVLANRFAFRTWQRRFSLAAMPEPEVRFEKGDSEDPPSFGLIVHLPSGGKFRYYSSEPLSLREQETAMEDLRERIRTMIADAGRHEPGHF